jgi:uncharacterized Fe-S cluster-containing radical SAM superfamily protein
MELKLLNTEALSAKFRAAAVDPAQKRLLITNFHGTQQEQDFSEPANCQGFGRIRHFRRTTSAGWPTNPLPIEPACRSLGLGLANVLRAQVFQNAVCNWRCWYCFVDFKLLSASRKHSAWLTPRELIDFYLAEPDPPPMIDLTGGQPDLTPEWVPWMMEELRERRLDKAIYLWSDDNLSNDYFWRYLSDSDRELICAYPNYGRVCCFKGFSAESFSFNTQAESALYAQQFDLMRRLMGLGIDLYAYVTLTSPSREKMRDEMRDFLDRLQSVAINLPLRTVPLEIQVFTPVKGRMDDLKNHALENQKFAIEAWAHELEERFSSADRGRPIVDVELRA